ncbi:MAG: GyrI-like domain-containing protein, partial [Thiohalomonadales bacterium]
KNLFLKKIQFDSDYLQHISSNISLTPEIRVQKEMSLVGFKTNFYSVDSEKNNIADKLPPLWDAFLARVNEIENRVNEKAYGVIQQTTEKTDHLEYYAAIEVSTPGNFPDDMEHITIPSSRYAIFTHKGNVTQINNTVNYIYSSWLLQSDRQHSYAADLEIYDQRYIADSDESIMEYAIPIV